MSSLQLPGAYSAAWLHAVAMATAYSAEPHNRREALFIHAVDMAQATEPDAAITAVQLSALKLLLQSARDDVADCGRMNEAMQAACTVLAEHVAMLEGYGL